MFTSQDDKNWQSNQRKIASAGVIMLPYVHLKDTKYVAIR